MDRFRIYALLKLIRGGTLNQKQIEQTKSTLQKKAQIYLKGCLKYSRPTESLLTELDEVLSNIDWIRFKEKVGLNDHSAMASYP